MARRPSTPSSSFPGAAEQSVPPRRSAAERALPSFSVREWLGGIRFTGFLVIILGLVVLGAFVLVPTIGTYLDQRQKISALQESVQLARDQVEELEKERERWNDPAYVTSQARERLFYVKPGEIVYIIDNDLPEDAIADDNVVVSSDVEVTQSNWMSLTLRSVVAAGLAKNAVSSENPKDPQPSSTPKG